MACASLTNSVYMDRRSTKLVFNLAPAVVQTFQRVLASAASGHQAQSSGPVRYVRKGPSKDQKPLDVDTGVKPDPQRSSTSTRQSGGSSKTFGKKKEPSDGERLSRSKSSDSGDDAGRPQKWPLSRTVPGKNDSKLEGLFSPLQNGLDPRMRLFASANSNDEAQLDGLGSENRGNSEDNAYVAAKNYAIGVLSKWPQTEKSIRGKLTRKNVPSQIIDQTVEDLQRWGLQSDMEYAHIYSRSRWTDLTWGPQRIKEELIRKGVDKETIDAALTDVFHKSYDDIDDCDAEDVHGWGMAPGAASRLIHQSRKQWVKSAPGMDARRNKMITWLQRRRFPWDTIMDIVKILESEKKT